MWRERMDGRLSLARIAIVGATMIVVPIEAEAEPMIIRGFDAQATGIRANPAVKLSVSKDRDLDELVLTVEYPEADDNPASRDVWSLAEIQDWTQGRAIVFKVKSDQAVRVSVSFPDGNGVAYTSWVDVLAGHWQDFEIQFADMKPNPYFQPPGADTDAPLNVAEVKAIGFAPQSPDAGRLTITSFAVVE